MTLSYVWGSTIKPCSLTCESVLQDGKTRTVNEVLNITANLDSALRHLRLNDKAQVLWIDAVCIDQRNEKERESQIQQMRNIYSRAGQTIVWLGEADESISAALKCIERLRSLSFRLSKYERDKLAVELNTVKCRPWLLRKDHICYISDDSWQAFRNLLRRSWFTRVWVFQEVTVSTTVTVRCGSLTVPWEDICRACNLVEEFQLDIGVENNQPLHTAVLIMHETNSAYSRPKLSYPEGASAPRPNALEDCPIMYASPGHEGNSYPRLDIMLLMMRWTKATDPRDKVYALLGISSGFSSSYLKPDYSISVAETYVRTAVCIGAMEGIRGLASLSFVQHGSRQLSSDLPSWTPDWRTPLNAPWLISNSGFTAAKVKDSQQAVPKYYLQNKQRSLGSGRNSRFEMHVSGYAIMKIVVLSSLAGNRRGLPPKSILDALPNPYICSFNAAYDEGLDPSHNFLGSLAPSAACRCKYSFWDPAFQSQRHVFETEVSWEGNDAEVLNHARCAPDIDIAAWDRADGITGISHGRRLFVTDLGYLGLAPVASVVGDEICIILGASVPYVIRREGSHCRFIGECYILGLMNGEAVEGLDMNLKEKFVFV